MAEVLTDHYGLTKPLTRGAVLAAARKQKIPHVRQGRRVLFDPPAVLAVWRPRQRAKPISWRCSSPDCTEGPDNDRAQFEIPWKARNSAETHYCCVACRRQALGRLTSERHAERGLYLTAAADSRGLNRKALTEAAASGRVRAERIGGEGTARRYRFNHDELDEDLARLHRCVGEECDKPALRDNDGCGSCGYGCANQPKSPRRRRRCRQCGKSRSIRAAMIEKGWGRFCSHSCASKWHNQRSGAVLTCSGCGKTRYRPPSLLGSTGGMCLECYTRSPQALEAFERCLDELLKSEAAVATIKEENGLHTTAEAAELQRTTQESILQWIHRGRLSAERYPARGGPYLISDAALTERERAVAREERPDEFRFLDPDWVLSWSEAKGLIVPKAGLNASEIRDAIGRRVQERRRLITRRIGHRPPATARIERWRSILQDLGDYYEVQVAIGEWAPTTQADLLWELALQDWQQVPEDWPRDRYPASRQDNETMDRKRCRVQALQRLRARPELRDDITKCLQIAVKELLPGSS